MMDISYFQLRRPFCRSNDIQQLQRWLLFSSCSTGRRPHPMDALFACIYHPPDSTDLRESVFIWYAENETVAAECKILDGDLDMTLREIAYHNNQPCSQISAMLKPFCQTILLPAPFTRQGLLASGTILQALMQSIPGSTKGDDTNIGSPAEQLPWGIDRVWRLQGRALQGKLETLAEDMAASRRHDGWCVRVTNIPHTAKNIIDFHPPPVAADEPELWHWSLCVNVLETRFLAQFGLCNARMMWDFQTICVIAFSWYAQALACVEQQRSPTSSANCRLIRKYGRAWYEQHTRILPEHEIRCRFTSAAETDVTDDSTSGNEVAIVKIRDLLESGSTLHAFDSPSTDAMSDLGQSDVSEKVLGCLIMPLTSESGSEKQIDAVAAVDDISTPIGTIPEVPTIGKKTKKKRKKKKKKKKTKQKTTKDASQDISLSSSVLPTDDTNPDKEDHLVSSTSIREDHESTQSNECIKAEFIVEASRVVHTDPDDTRSHPHNTSDPVQQLKSQYVPSLPSSIPEQHSTTTSTAPSVTLSDTAPTPTEHTTSIFKFNEPSPHLICHLPPCTTMTISSHPNTTICPACGPTSLVRYCSPAHLFLEMPRHHATDCCNPDSHILPSQIAPSTLPLRLPIPYLGYNVFTPSTASNPITSHLGSLARHRQATALALQSPTADYYLFHTPPTLPTGPVTLITIPNSSPLDTRQSQFRLDLASILSCPINSDTPTLQIAAVRVVDAIRLCLEHTGLWTKEVVDRLRAQIRAELNWEIPAVMLKIPPGN